MVRQGLSTAYVLAAAIGLFGCQGTQKTDNVSDEGSAPPEIAQVEAAEASVEEVAEDDSGSPIVDQANAKGTPTIKVPDLVKGIGNSVKAAGARYTVDKNRLYGYRYFQKGKYRYSIVYFLACLDKEPNDLKSQYYTGRIALEQYKDPTYARRHLEMAYELKLKHFRKDHKGRIIYQRLNKTQVPWPSYDLVADKLAEAIIAEGDRQGLVQFLDKTVADRGTSADFIRKGRLLQQLNDADNAQLAYRKAIDVASPKDPEPFIAMARFYQSLNARDNEIRQLRHAIYLDGSNEGVKKRFLELGIVPGPTVGVAPPPKPSKIKAPKEPDLPAPGAALPGRG